MTLPEKVLDTNRIIRMNPWMDMSILSFNGSDLVIAGSIDFSVEHTVELTFFDVYWMDIRVNWHTNTKNDNVFLLSGEEAFGINLKYNIEIGYNVFKIITEDFVEPIYIAAMDIECKMTRVKYINSL